MSERQKNTEEPLGEEDLQRLREGFQRFAATPDQIADAIAQVQAVAPKEQTRVASALLNGFREGSNLAVPGEARRQAQATPAAVIGGGRRAPVQLDRSTLSRDPVDPSAVPEAVSSMSFVPKELPPVDLNTVPLDQLQPGQVGGALAANQAAQEASLLDQSTLLGKQVEEQAALRESFEPDFAALEAERQLAQAEAIERQERALAQYESQLENLLSTPMSSDRLFSGASGAAQFAAILGPAVGSLIQFNNNINFPGSNTPNTAARMINDAIERDVQTQRMNFQRNQEGLRGQQTIYNIARQLGLDEQQAMDITRLRLKDEVGRRLFTMAGVHAGQQQQMRLQQMARNYRDQILREKQGQIASLVAQQQAAMGSGQAAPTEEQPILGFFVDPSATGTSRDWGKMPAADKRLVRSTLNQGRESMVAMRTILRYLRSGATLNNTPGAEAGITPIGKTVQQLITEVILATKQEYALGAWDDGARQILSQLVGGDPTKFSLQNGGTSRRNAIQAFSNLLTSLERRSNGFAYSHGLTPRFTDAQGQTSPHFAADIDEAVLERARESAQATQERPLAAVEQTLQDSPGALDTGLPF